MKRVVYLSALLWLASVIFPTTTLLAQQSGGVSLQFFPMGDHNGTQNEKGEWVIPRTSKETFDLAFSITGCDDPKALEISIENPRNRAVKVKGGKKGQFHFPVQLYQERNVYTLRAHCGGAGLLEQRVIVHYQPVNRTRLDTALIFAVTKHQKPARKEGWEDLDYSLNDALALKWTLENKFGFAAQIIKDPTWEDLNGHMQQLRRRRWGPTDQLFIFFTGHGHKTDDGTGYLIPANAGSSVKTYYKMEDLRDQIDGIGCNNISLLIDACFAASFLERGGSDVTRSSAGGAQTHQYLSSSFPFRYFIGSAPSNQEVPEKGIFLKDSQAAKGKYKTSDKKFKVSAFMMAFLQAIQMGENYYGGKPIPVWYVGRKMEDIYRPKKAGKGAQFYARATRFGSQTDKGFHFISQ